MPHRHRFLTAWLGVLAIWFAIVVPIASQWRIAQTAAPDAVICSTAHGEPRMPSSGGAHHAAHLDACGYCSFFSHSPAIGGPSTALDLSISVPVVSVTAPASVVASVERYPRAYPRAPPGNA